MRVQDFTKATDVSDETELKKALAPRYQDDANLFWLTHYPELYPALVVHVKGHLAVLNYLSGDGGAGFVSEGTISSLDPNQDAVFPSSITGEKDYIPNYQLVPLSAAYAAAWQFLKSPELPKAVKWSEL